MTIEQINQVDGVSLDKDGSTVILTISDHLDWGDQRKHLLILQEKINTYIRFVQNGELFIIQPVAKGKPILIDVVIMEPMPQIGVDFISKSRGFLEPLGISIRSRRL